MTPETWAKARPLIERALRYAGGTHEPEDVKEAIEEGRLQLWCGRESVIVTEVVTYPRLKACRIFLAGGDMKELTHVMEPAVCRWAKDIGFVRMEIGGRFGWQRVLKDYRRLCVCLTKELGE